MGIVTSSVLATFEAVESSSLVMSYLSLITNGIQYMCLTGL